MTPYYQDDHLTVYLGDCRAVLRELPGESVHCVVTSPPYWGLRDYGVAGQLGLEPTPEAYIAAMVEVFRDARRVLRSDGTLWLNMGDSYAATRSYQVPDSKHRDVGNSRGMTTSRRRDDALIPRSDLRVEGLKPKDLIGMPWRLAFALQADGWWLRSDIIWSKPNAMPESVTDRPTKAHEYVFLLTKSGSAIFWTHRDGRRVNVPPPPDYRWRNRTTGEERTTPTEGEDWRRVNLWSGHDYYYDAEAVREPATHAGEVVVLGEKSLSRGQATGMNREPSGNGKAATVTVAAGRNIRSVWTVATEPYPGAHFATFPRKLVEPCILAGCPPDGVVLDPFAGSGTTLLVAQQLGRRAIGIDLSADYMGQCLDRNRQAPLGLVG